MACILAGFALGACAEPRIGLDPRFMDGMVVQRGAALPVSGYAAPQGEVTVTLGAAEARTRAGADGRWEAILPPLDAATGLTLRASGAGASVQRVDIAAGDVFLCSGQSNMAWPVRLALNPDRELQGPYRADMRLLQVPQTSAIRPQAALPPGTAWQVASRERAADFSALCYFFGRDWQAKENVPVGLINASWGGSRIEPWISPEMLAGAPHLADRLRLLAAYAQDPAAGMTAYGESWEAWWRDAAGTAPWTDGLDAPKPVPGPLRDWKEFGDPELSGFLGMVWHERRVSLTPAQAAGAAELSLGGIDEIDAVWVNGRFIGSTFGWGTPRTYTLPAGTLKAGENHILVNVHNGWAEGGMTGPEDALFIRPVNGAPVPLSGGWAYQKVPPGLPPAPQMPWMSVSGLSGLYQGMIAPLAGLPMKGALWYQGESNTGDAETYELMLRLLTADFRRQFGEALPVLIVQLPEFGARMSAPGNSGWSSLREAQRRFALSDDRAGLIVALGAGDAWDIHPPNKQEVARRMRDVWAAVLTDPVSPVRTGHSPSTAIREGSMIRVSLPDASGDYTHPGTNEPAGFMLCKVDGTDCVFAAAQRSGAEIRVEAPEAEHTTLRYCWGDTPFCNLMTPEGRPVTPFELAVE
ncbi:sialate O-acetylesterase [Hyphomonas sp.]|uniref:sialate O-acetylesterase n=1 Tax=Hyphomonas sp. TaxID=87 RepID=UPI00391BF24C